MLKTLHVADLLRIDNEAARSRSSRCLRACGYAPHAAAGRQLFARLIYAIRGADVPDSPVQKWQACRSGMAAI